MMIYSEFDKNISTIIPLTYNAYYYQLSGTLYFKRINLFGFRLDNVIENEIERFRNYLLDIMKLSVIVMLLDCFYITAFLMSVSTFLLVKLIVSILKFILLNILIM